MERLSDSYLLVNMIQEVVLQLINSLFQNDQYFLKSLIFYEVEYQNFNVINEVYHPYEICLNLNSFIIACNCYYK